MAGSAFLNGETVPRQNLDRHRTHLVHLRQVGRILFQPDQQLIQRRLIALRLNFHAVGVVQHPTAQPNSRARR